MLQDALKFMPHTRYSYFMSVILMW
uniref:Uncharacterized protein n=1 Tax=Rhizophora mucronata TaxID=61149 RepID=A0A2P2QG31_RHIMU